MKLQLKRSNVLVSGAAKEPTASQLDYGELAINYSAGDAAIFLKDSTNNVIRISGVGNIADDGLTNVPTTTSPPTSPTPEAGNLWYNSEDGRLYIYYVDDNSSQWVDASPDTWQTTVIPDTTNPAHQAGTLDDRYINTNGDTLTGALLLDNAASAAAPDLAFDSDSNTGIYSPGADSLAITTAGTQRVTVNSSGRVGIGTTSPDAPLQVGVLDSPGTLRGGLAVKTVSNGLGNSEAAIYIEESSGGEGYYLRVDSDGGLAFDNSAAIPPTLYLSDSNKVGIGTSSPVRTLHIHESSSSDNAYVHLTSATTGTTTSDGLALFLYGSGGLKDGVLTLRETANLLFKTGDLERMRITSSGNVSIGISTINLPSGKGLQVYDSSSPRIKLANSTTGTGIGDGSLLYLSGSDLLIDNKESANMRFYTSATERMRINSSGMIGINENNPGHFIDMNIGSTNVGIKMTSTDPGAYIQFADNSTTAETRVGAVANDLKFDVNNAERMRIDSSGNVLIGNPAGFNSGGIVNIQTAGNKTISFNASQSELGNVASICARNDSGSSLVSFGMRANDLRFATGSSERMRIDSSGNVGIGTADPDDVGNFSRALDVSGASGASVLVRNNNSSLNCGLFAYYGTSTYVMNRAAGPILFYTSNTEKMQLDSSGRLGIGTSSPIAQLTARAINSNGQGGTMCIQNTGTGVGTNVALYLTPNNGGGNDLQRSASIKSSQEISGNFANLEFYTSSSDTPAERMRIDSSGNVLIGTTTLFGSGGITLTNAGAIVSPQVYGQVVSSSPRDVHVDSVGLFGYVSSIRESKANIRAQSNVDWIYQLEPVTFNYRIKNHKTGKYTGIEPNVEYGLIAEDVESICPELCFYDETDDGQKLRGIHYKKLITPMLKALQDAKSKIETLEQRLSDAGIA